QRSEMASNVAESLRDSNPRLGETRLRANGRSTKPTKPDDRLVVEIQNDRCKLLGLSARERPNPQDDDLRWSPIDVGRIDDPSDNNPRLGETRPRAGEPRRRASERADYDNDRMSEIELAHLDARNGFRHAVAEMLPDLSGQPSHAGRQPWKPPPETAEAE